MEPIQNNNDFRMGELSKLAEMQLAATNRIENEIKSLLGILGDHTTRITKLESRNDHRKENASFVFSIIAAIGASVAVLHSFNVFG